MDFIGALFIFFIIVGIGFSIIYAIANYVIKRKTRTIEKIIDGTGKKDYN